jgi:hypothetical protein
MHAQHAVVLLPDPHHAARGISLCAHIQLNVLGTHHVIMLRTQAVGMKSLQAAERPADLLSLSLSLSLSLIGKYKYQCISDLEGPGY